MYSHENFLPLSTVSSLVLPSKYKIPKAVEKKENDLAHEHEIFVVHDAIDRPCQHLARFKKQEQTHAQFLQCV